MMYLEIMNPFDSIMQVISNLISHRFTAFKHLMLKQSEYWSGRAVQELYCSVLEKQ